MIIVFFESPFLLNSYCEHVSTFNSEADYMEALPELERQADEKGLIVTEIVTR